MTTAPKHSVKVSILNEEFTIRSDTAPEHTRAVAEYFDGVARQVMSGGNVVESNRAVILAALRITAELFEERRGSEALSGSMKALSDEVRRLLPPAKR
jgi:cell division protein ZapA